MKIVTWNVNSIRQRESHVLSFLAREQPDVLCLQEIKCETGQFPAAAFRDAGYEAVVVGQKAYNGVAILARVPFTATAHQLPPLEDATPQARYVEIEVAGLRVGNLYLPNGNSNGDAGYAAKLAFMDALAEHARSLLETDTDFVLTGDYNVCPTDEDLAPGALPASDALVRPQTRAAFRRLIWLGLTDALRALHPTGAAYTFWDYQAGAWPRNIGLRIDHALLSPRLAERLVSCEIARDERGETQPSDHVPLAITLA
ncbi:exodeoxyribonuclease III [Ameyamaea chiangmaiensis NBRC 103196]|uniref:Exodeoxyribonuclease III n=1 Tax=Ameyamaea chiangmaiensis TaxID=442969 RepID=A0A850P9Y3_9PROT|nr:exodeoxyribonuclease III [Ameyamaea chiangmaiensis]MBS4073993.1 exodeoxyribonuclease III [Ameyamaea chiangmaiensis]NVN40844.1 exodeoxyribonuclease III [Ameyamaea chiangmaiensis]GBQ67681.1 exodeoxyribonuclease III [Ameyamaea chiangmaiensis NBRC 103196]